MSGSRKAWENRKVRAVPRALVALVLCVSALPVAAAEPDAPPLQLAFLGVDAPDDAPALVLADIESAVVAALREARVPLLTPGTIAELTGTPVAPLRACLGVMQPCEVPAALQPLSALVIARVRMVNGVPHGTLIAVGAEGERLHVSPAIEGRVAKLAVRRWRERAAQLPHEIARRTGHRYAAPWPMLTIGLGTSVIGAGALAGGTVALVQSAMADARLRGTMSPSPLTPYSARELAEFGQRRQQLGLVLVPIGAATLAVGVWSLVAGVGANRPVPVVVPTGDGGALALFAGSLP